VPREVTYLALHHQRVLRLMAAAASSATRRGARSRATSVRIATGTRRLTGPR
jgi:hypothetical protein